MSTRPTPSEAWADFVQALADEGIPFLRRNAKLFLGIAIGYICAGVIIYLDRFLQSIGVTR